MNFLAHLLLAENHAASRVGNLLGDFVTGRPEVLLERLPEPIVAGIVRHRAVDAFTDAHPVTARLRGVVAPERRRFAGAITDVFHDHFLTRRWAEFSDERLEDFTGSCNAALLLHRVHLPAELGDDLDEKIADRWLEHYGTDEGLEGVFARMARRRPAFAVLAGAVDDLRAGREVFAEGFDDFFPELLRYVQGLGPE